MSVTVRFCGAARTVTGASYLFETGSGRILVDCGLFQGPKTLKELNYGACSPDDLRTYVRCVLCFLTHINFTSWSRRWALSRHIRTRFPEGLTAPEGLRTR